MARAGRLDRRQDRRKGTSHAGRQYEVRGSGNPTRPPWLVSVRDGGAGTNLFRGRKRKGSIYLRDRLGQKATPGTCKDGPFVRLDQVRSSTW